METGTLDETGAEATLGSRTGGGASSGHASATSSSGPGSSDFGPAVSTTAGGSSAGGSSAGTSTTTGLAESTGDDEPPEVSGTGELSCTDDYRPVCGRDGETYDHPCDAIAAGVEIRREGPCLGDCEGSCSVQGSAVTSMLILAIGLAVRPRRGRRSALSRR